MNHVIPKRQLLTLALIGLLILLLFATGLAWLYDHGVDVFLAYAPFWIYPYLAVISVYVGFFAARFAKGRWNHAWLWGIGGFALTLTFILGIPGLLSAVFPHPGLTIFAGPAIFIFLAPVLSALSIVLFISIRTSASV